MTAEAKIRSAKGKGNMMMRTPFDARLWMTGVAVMSAAMVISCRESTPPTITAPPAATKPAASATPAAPAASATKPTTSPFVKVGQEEILHNAHVVTDKIISGAQPEGDASFKLLGELGVKTIISVDGAKPDIEGARKYGIRYIHIPIGYDGVHEAQGEAIAKALDEMPGKIYVHCHHGKHRSAAAVAVACVYNGMLRPDQAELVLQTFGTGANYKGLWKDARGARPLDPAVLKNLDYTFVEVAKINDLAAMMVSIDEHNDHLKLIKKAGWKTPANHPDLNPPHIALQLQENLFECGRLESASHPANFGQWVNQGEAAAKRLTDLLNAKPVDTEAADVAFGEIAQSCVDCHKVYRD